MEIRRYIVGVDGSVPARAAIRWALAGARERGVGVTLVHVADDEWGAVGSRLIEEVDQDAGKRLDEELDYARSLGTGVPVGGEVRLGSPMAELASYSDPGTMIVVGTHKTGFHYGRAFGSRSLQLANLATGPVAIVPEAASRMRRGVIVGVDDTPAGEAAVDLAADLACDHHCELMTVRSSEAHVPFDVEDGDERRDWQLRRDDEARGVLASAVSRARARQSGIVIRSRVVRRPAGAALNELARSAELLVIGDSRRAHAQLGSLGAVAYDVLLNLSSPTIVVHAPTAEVRREQSRTEGESHVIG
ncbi:universal stress protein [Leifsonia shinshuensis]|uniref:Universal stress protein n=1 Tax=Leifsonia shinshuensis TaxID=150026 RepID=A0A7G6YER4_9MICO|nr:universal stress protein [Leifsonia shinshuensis]QNE36979.1 universal stress protein [Leifsonia shinshuensis]